jgi:hypothetical protein
LIDSGNQGARVAFAKKMDEIGLFAFSQDHYINMLEEPQLVDEASAGLVRNAVWMRNFEEAERLLIQYPQLIKMYSRLVSDSRRQFCLLSFSVENTLSVVSTIIHDEVAHNQKLEQTDPSEHLYLLAGLQVVMEAKLNFSLDLHQSPDSMHSLVQVDAFIGGDISISRPAIEVMGTPETNCQNLLRNAANLVAFIHQSLTPNEQTKSHVIDLMQEAGSKGRMAINRLMLLTDMADVELEEKQFLANVSWALNESPSVNDRYAAFLMNGLI